MAKRATLSGIKHTKPASEAIISPTRMSEQAKESTDKAKGLIVRLDPVAHKQLKQLALDLDTSINALMIEGLNAIFEKHGKPPIA